MQKQKVEEIKKLLEKSRGIVNFRSNPILSNTNPLSRLIHSNSNASMQVINPVGVKGTVFVIKGIKELKNKRRKKSPIPLDKLEYIREWVDFVFIQWGNILENYLLPEDVIIEFEKYLKKFSWEEICATQELSEEFMEREVLKDIDNYFQNMRGVITYQDLSENFIEKNFLNVHNLNDQKLIWGYISRYQKLTDIFILKHIDLIQGEHLIHNTRIQYTFYQSILGRNISVL